MKSRRKRFLKGVVLAFAVAAFAAPVAQAREYVSTSTSSATSGYTPQQLRALELRSAGMNAIYGSASSTYSPQALRALELRSQGMDARYGLASNTAGSVKTTQSPVLVASSGGFSWGDAFVGAAATFATGLVVLFAIATTRRRQPLGV
jgi:hypothetical protein